MMESVFALVSALNSKKGGMNAPPHQRNGEQRGERRRRRARDKSEHEQARQERREIEFCAERDADALKHRR
ncbi:hypothetical protein BRDID11002_70960 [Bradyrhizobium diazoefficiens]